MSLVDCIDGQQVYTDGLLRKEESKDSIYELEMLKRSIVKRYKSKVLQPWEAKFMDKNKRLIRTKEAKGAKSEYDKIMKEVAVTADELEKMQIAVLSMETYKRLNAKLCKEIARLRAERAEQDEHFQSKIKQLEEDLEVAERSLWCREQVQDWEPERDPSYKTKDLSILGGPRSPPRSALLEPTTPGSPSIRLVMGQNKQPLGFDKIDSETRTVMEF